MPTTMAGQEKVVAIALDLTGKKMTDEICHIAAYCYPEKTFSQYVMPFRDISPPSVRTHGLRIFTTFGRFRVLKESAIGKSRPFWRSLRTKSEYSSLCDFMQWLKEVKGDAGRLLLAFHDNNKDMVSSFLLEALSHYKLADEFFEIVGDFVNVAKFVEDQYKDKEPEAKPNKLSLRILSKQLTPPPRSPSSSDSDGQEKEKQEKPRNRNRGVSMQSAKTRADCTFRVLQKFMNCEDAEIIGIDQLQPFRINREEALTKLEQQKEQLKELEQARTAQAKARANSKGDRNRNEKKKDKETTTTKIPEETTVPSSCAVGEDLKAFTECQTQLIIPSN